ADIATSGTDAGNYSFNATATDLADITPAPTTITVQDALADCEGDEVVLIATVNTDNSAIQSDVDDFGGTVTFKNGTTTIATVSKTSVVGGVFSGSFPISLPLGSTYNISAEFVPTSGNLIGSNTEEDAELTVFEVFITSSVIPNVNGNVVIFDGAASSLGLPSSTTLTATYQPSTYTGGTYKWYYRNVGGSFTLISGATSASYTVLAQDDFVREYMVEISIGGQCVANTVFSKVVSVEASCGKAGQNKVQVCHVTPNGKRKTICVSANAVNALLNGSPGSYVGNCNISYRAEQDPELITVAWNTPVELIKGEIVKQSEKWFNRKKINMNISAEAYNSLLPGMYTLTAELEENDFYELEEPIAINVLVLDKPMALDVTISNDQLAKDLRSGQVIGTLSTIDPIDNIHTYSLAENEQVELNGDQLIWKGSSVPATFTVQVMSTDRAGQTISRAITLRKELKLGEFFMYPNPASTETNIMLDLDESATVAFQVYDAIGRLVIQDEVYKVGSFTHTIKVDELAPGMYTVQLKVGDMVMTKRLIKK
ncbi:T9SS type A sorting domain-containing protein, partial [Algoriphagus sp.]|uniref:T9SS type A sorting domain-containing protein n=1 Tax=Algoriphagus sp. TaxID=1872435 RepID=UPI00391A2057